MGRVDARPEHARWGLGAVIVALPALVVYVRTLEPSVYFVDSGLFLATIKVFGIAYAPGFPLYILLATAWTRVVSLLPHLLTFTQAANYFSSLAATATAVIVYATTFEITRVGSGSSGPLRPEERRDSFAPHQGRQACGASSTPGGRTPRSESSPTSRILGIVESDRRWLAWIAAIFAGWLTAFAYTIWSQAITAAPYTLEGTFSALVLYLAIRLGKAEPIAAPPTSDQRHLTLALAAAYGCAWAVHYLAVGLVPFLAFLAYRYRNLWRQRQFACLTLATFLLFGAGPYLYEPIRSAAWPVVDWGHPANLSNFVLQLTGATWTSRPSNFRVFDPVTILPALDDWATLTFYQFFPLTLLLTLLGGWFIHRWHQPLFVPLVLFYVGSVAVPVVYVTNNDESYLIPAHLVLASAAGVGLAGSVAICGAAWRRRGHAPFGNWLGWAVASGVAVLLVGGTVATNYPELDRHDDYVVEDYAQNALRGVPAGGIMLVPGDELNAAILFLQIVRNDRPDVTVIPESTVHFAWWRQSFRRHQPSFFLPDVSLDHVSTDAQWLGELTAQLIQHHPVRTVYMLTLAGRQIPGGYTPVPAGIGYRLVAQTDPGGQRIHPDDWNFPPVSLSEVTQRPHFLQAAYNSFLQEIQLAYMQAFQNLGDHDFVQGRYSAAAKDYATGLRFVPNQTELRLGEGASLAKLGDLQSALSDLAGRERPTGLNAARPDSAQLAAAFGHALNAVGDQMYQQGQASRAFADYQLAYQVDPSNPAIIANWGAALAVRGDYLQGFNVLRRGLEIAPENAQLYFNLGQVDQAMGKTGPSQQMFARAFALDPRLKELARQP